MAKSELTPKQQRFCEEYLIDLNATQAAIRAGYSEKTARNIAGNLLTKINIQEFIAQKQTKRSEKVEITAADVLNEYKIIGFSCIEDYFDIDENTGEMKLKSFDRMPPGASRAIEWIKQDRVLKEDKSGDAILLYDKVTIKLWNKSQALEMISRHTGGFVEKKQVDSNVNINTHENYVVEVVQKEAEERLKKLASGTNRIKDVM